MSVRRGLPVVALLVLAGCAPGEPPSNPSGDTGTSTETSRESATPSITREVPADERRALPDLSAEQLCGVVTTNDLRQLAFAVEDGQPRKADGNPPTPSCWFDSSAEARSILLGTQPTEYWRLGRDEVELGSVVGTKTLYTNNCTVYAPVRGSTLQVTVREPDADSEQCDAAESVAHYAVSALAR